MSLSPQFLDELRARTSLSALVGRTVKLQRAGREFKACCPFHNEKTPSFTLSDEKGFYHCFGCGAHGDAIRWLTDARGLPFIDAVKELADAAGLELPQEDHRARQRAEEVAGLHEVLEQATQLFEAQLNGLEGGSAREYLKGRSLTDETIRKFRLGYSLESRGALKSALAQLGVPLLIDAGLLIQPDDGGEPYDRFRGRLMIPITDQRGRVIAFGARILKKGEPKYLNSPDTPLFDKGRTLFNLDKAGPASRSAKRLIVVEGYMDVIALDQAGLSEAVAPLGTAVTESQIERLWRLSGRPLFCFDGDAAGQSAANRAARRALPLAEPGRTLGFVTLPPGQDPDDLIRSGATAALKGFLTRPESLAQRLWRSEAAQVDAANPESRAALLKRLLDLAGEIRNPLVRSEYASTFKDQFYSTFGWRKREVQNARSLIAESKPKGAAKGEYVLHRAVMLGLSRYPEVLKEELELVLELQLASALLQRWRDLLVDAVMERPLLTEDLVEAILASSDIAPIERRDLARDLGFSFFRRRDPERARSDLREVIATLVAEKQVETALQHANARFKEAQDDAQWDRQKRLLDEQRSLSSRISLFAEEAAQSEAA